MHNHFVKEKTYWRDSKGNEFKVEHVSEQEVYYFNLKTKQHYHCREEAFISRFTNLSTKYRRFL